jgi:hypothetical protein
MKVGLYDQYLLPTLVAAELPPDWSERSKTGQG